MTFRQLSMRCGNYYDVLYEQHPYRTAGLTMAAQAAISDIMAQKLVDADCDVDLERLSKFTFFCAVYAGCFQHAVFNILFPRLFPGNGWKVALKKTLADNFVHTPFVYLPSYFILKSMVDKDRGTVLLGMQEYHTAGLPVLVDCWSIWIPAQFVAFAFIPVNFRILYNAAVGTVWDTLLSFTMPLNSGEKKNGSPVSVISPGTTRS